MSTFEDEEFATGESGASKTEPKQCSLLRKGGYVLMKERPCKIMEMSTSKTGKHGSAKVHLVGIDIFTGKKYEEICPSSQTMYVPIIARKEYQLIDVKDGFLSLMSDDLCVLENIPVPDNDVGKEIQEKWNSKGDMDNVIVTIVTTMDEQQAHAVRTSSDK
uniref:Eukaryotic translation initiation factor 5A n=1 Tax=Schistosoma japonicum TaxID=6182 RepID=C1LB71_SCHJA|nr:eukaryotic translation initiation factor 5A [Schistosoma japonicum]